MIKTNKIVEFGEFRLNPAERTLERNGDLVPLVPKLFELLVFLSGNAGRLLDKATLLQSLWPDTFVEEATLARNISELRKVLGDGRESPRYIETVPKAGYRFIAAVRDVAPETEPLPALPGVQDHPKRSRIPVLLAAVALVVVLVLSVKRWGTPTVPAVRSIAILPFQTTSTLETDRALAFGVAANLRDVLSSSRSIEVHEAGSGDGGADPLARARALKVESVVAGTLEHVGDLVRVTARLLRVQDGKILWAGKIDRPWNEWFQVEDALAAGVSGALTGHLEVRPVPSVKNQEAHQLVMKGNYFLARRSQEGLRKAVGYFEQAMQVDRGESAAHAGLAKALILSGGSYFSRQTEMAPRARAEALEALRLNRSNAEAHAVLGLIAENYDLDWASAQQRYKQAIEADANDPTAHHWLGELVAMLGRFDEGFAELHRAQELAPVSIPIASDIAKCLMLARRYDEAIGQIKSVIEMDPAFPAAHHWLASVYFLQGKYEAAIEESDRAESPELAWTTRAVVYARTGRAKESQQYIERLKKLAGEPGFEPISMACLYAQTGDVGEAMEWLERVYRQRSIGLASLRTEPSYDGIRGDPRFQAFVQRLGL